MMRTRFKKTSAFALIVCTLLMAEAPARAANCGNVTASGTASATNEGTCPASNVCPAGSERDGLADMNARTNASVICARKAPPTGDKACKLRDKVGASTYTYQCQEEGGFHVCTTTATATYQCNTGCSASGGSPSLGFLLALGFVAARRVRRRARGRATGWRDGDRG